MNTGLTRHNQAGYNRCVQIFGTSGIRYKADRDLLELAFRCGLCAGGRQLRVVVASDSRTSSPAVKSALVSGLNASGSSCWDAGLVSTPTVAYAASGFDIGVMITASHNPPEYNGIKFFNPDGTAYSDGQKMELEKRVLDSSINAVCWKEFGSQQLLPDAAENHIQAILSCFSGSYPLKVVLDCGGGAASRETPLLLKRMGCEVVELNCEPNGVFPRPSEPLEENLKQLKDMVISSGADLGLAHDGDADRLMAVDGRGRFINGDALLVILAQGVGAKRVITTIDASSVIEEQDFEVRRTPVGDNFISLGLKDWGDFGGEPSGSWVFPNFSYCPDGLFAAAQVVAIAATHKLSSLADGIPQYPIRRTSVELDRELIPAIMQKLVGLGPDTVDRSDGIKLVFSDSWVLVRPSGTEPKIRLTVQARDWNRVESLYEQVISHIKVVAGKELCFK